MRFINVNELKFTEVELFLFFQFEYVTADASEFFCMAHLKSNERFLYHSTFNPKNQIFKIKIKLASLI